jgi:hypothetical protein
LEKSTESNEAVINNAWESIYDNMKIAVWYGLEHRILNAE